MFLITKSTELSLKIAHHIFSKAKVTLNTCSQPPTPLSVTAFYMVLPNLFGVLALKIIWKGASDWLLNNVQWTCASCHKVVSGDNTWITPRLKTLRTFLTRYQKWCTFFVSGHLYLLKEMLYLSGLAIARTLDHLG